MKKRSSIRWEMYLHCLKAMVMKMAQSSVSSHIFLEPWKRNQATYSVSKHTIDIIHVSSKCQKKEKEQQRN